MNRTPADRLNEILADFRAREPAAAPWLAEENVRRVLRAWRDTPARLTIPLTIGGVPMHAHNRWRYAWKFRDLDANALADVAGLPAADVSPLVDRLAQGRFIYPDGTLSAPAAAALA